MRFLTLTIKNQPELKPMIKHLLKSFRKLRQRAWWKKNVEGGCFVIELAGRPGNWHAHIHAVVQAHYMPFRKLLSLWQKCSGGGRGVFIQLIPTSALVGYLTKYLTKATGIPEVDEAYNGGLKGVRLFSPFGTWYAANRTYQKALYTCQECKTIPALDYAGRDFYNVDSSGRPEGVDPLRIQRTLLDRLGLHPD